ncbi:hypothetical protein L202_00884 [Cryptococcus amylolentus CBS 6039]|uniref:Uncharacterized protein n=2 Tax=Cryptococcus amylolentus TaxID=104669 RepID=A0A1E3I9I6_9TREE|nr:hypothetical protein L202_00884 [Cryptococcus amylolentus CBS 6039]ODN85055.1 hypothetical protein L202_00884 [Cryptococcus amylolentus CBS 6039]ODO11267.1 hypothetical protein I350_00042 [Cryptococcus amylolentus CBS 6273]
MSIEQDNFSNASDGSDIHEEPTPSASNQTTPTVASNPSLRYVDTPLASIATEKAATINQRYPTASAEEKTSMLNDVMAQVVYEQGWDAGSIVMFESTEAGSVEGEKAEEEWRTARTQGWTGDAGLTARAAVFDGYSKPHGENAGNPGADSDKESYIVY